jgi:ABC-2 type transport system ATP-binding protein
MLELKELSKTYGKVSALKEVSLIINEGESVVFVGPEGSGKSTVFRVATALTPPTGGTIVLNGKDLASDSVAIREDIGFLPQTNPLYDEMLLYDYLRYVARLKGIARSHVAGSVKAVGEVTGLIEQMNMVIGDMNRSMKRLVGLAQTLLGDPKILFVDAPYEGLDEEEIVPVKRLLQSIAKKKTLCIATENLDTATTLGERLIVMNRGQVVADASVEELLSKEAQVARFILVVKGPKPEEATEIIQKLKVVEQSERITTRKPEMTGLEITGKIDGNMKQILKDMVLEQEWELVRIGRKTLDLHGIYERLTGA